MQPAKAYLILKCDPVTNAPVGADIWSSPEWEQTRTLNERTFVVYVVESDTFENAIAYLLWVISNPTCRYHYVYVLLSDDLKLSQKPVNPEPQVYVFRNFECAKTPILPQLPKEPWRKGRPR